MKDFLVINQQGNLVDKSKQYSFSGGGQTVVNWGAVTSSYINTIIPPQGSIVQLPIGTTAQMIGPSSLVSNQISVTSGAQLANPNGVSFGFNAGTTIINMAAPVRYISGNPADYGFVDEKLKSAPGGVFYKDQEGPKYSPVIVGKFSNKI